MNIKLSRKDLDLIGKALLSHRWKIEDTKGQNDEFNQCATLADRLSCNHNGATISFNPPE